jgi:hypothetical protein
LQSDDLAAEPIDVFFGLYAGFLTFAQNVRRPFDQAAFPFGDHIGMHSKSGRQL